MPEKAATQPIIKIQVSRPGVLKSRTANTLAISATNELLEQITRLIPDAVCVTISDVLIVRHQDCITSDDLLFAQQITTLCRSLVLKDIQIALIPVDYKTEKPITILALLRIFPCGTYTYAFTTERDLRLERILPTGYTFKTESIG